MRKVRVKSCSRRFQVIKKYSTKTVLPFSLFNYTQRNVSDKTPVSFNLSLSVDNTELEHSMARSQCGMTGDRTAAHAVYHITERKQKQINQLL